MNLLNGSSIEYLTHGLSAHTGCLHTMAECPTSDKCWASAMAHRFHRSFEPAWHPEVLGFPDSLQKFKPRKPAHIGVAFGGEMFGDFNLKLWGEELWEEMVREVLKRIALAPQHRFYFLTKAPQNLARFNPWPDNALVGLSLTGAETSNAQGEKFDTLLQVEAKHLWLSYEPMLGHLAVSALPISWLVLGAQSGHGAVKPLSAWVWEVEAMADRYGVKIWRKNNLVKTLGIEPRQERP